jgi:hypothetical protein
VSLEAFSEEKGGSPVTEVLCHLELPALQRLAFALRSWKELGDERLFRLGDFSTFISRSQCTLKTFSLECIPISTADCIVYRPLLSNVTTLVVTENRRCIYKELLDMLANVDHEDGILLPQLQHFEYNFHARSSRYSDYSTIFSQVVSLLECRWEIEKDAVRRLDFMKLKGAKPDARLVLFPAYVQLDNFREKGFNLEMYFCS